MQGNEECPGIVPKALEELFRLKEKMKNNFHVTFECNMVEIYLNNLNDCLSHKPLKDRPKLEIKEDAFGQIYIENIVNFSLENLQSSKEIY